ncbi:uncharacterized protein BO66DRAFT_226607 [Aspergillus aculeatinus CBS 121060]|uniref:Uncharacterized protein n=1 Tax=Aspergillus aculeatinus CBS 121060 TaxID=1448322 RepID=A0ACD1HIU0_9EURO|nr:hypothetical protein BO66DRAFT_226607 [Aspergillus aculeatinus CBS 121060]RAH73582.1 hypothetical protein BO66DRAFT_226607 [Aspergillus aculeatinus CBS 121060]
MAQESQRQSTANTPLLLGGGGKKCMRKTWDGSRGPIVSTGAVRILNGTRPLVCCPESRAEQCSVVHDSNSCSRAEPDHKAVEEGGEFGSHIQQSVSSTTCLGWLIRPVEYVLQKQMQGRAGHLYLKAEQSE